MKTSRMVAVGLVASAALWIGSAYLLPTDNAEVQAAIRPVEAKVQPPFRVSVATAHLSRHSPTLTLSGRTEADHKVTITARASGIVAELRVKRGQRVKKDEIIAVLADEAREAQVKQAQALFDQRKAELDARRLLIDKGSLPKLDMVNLESQYAAAQAALASAKAERDRGIVRAPWDGVITDVLAEVGAAAFSFTGTPIATLVSLDPMLAVAEVSENRLAGVKVGEKAQVRLITGQVVPGRVRYVAETASPGTRTYRVEVAMANPDGKIPDGITSEVALTLSPVPAARVARSALTISSSGQIGLRIVDGDDSVGFVPVHIVQDGQETMWVSGLPDGARVIVRGQDFVREGQVVAATEVNEQTASR